MLSFWVLAALLTCFATASVVWPLLRKRTVIADRSDEESRRLAIYRDRRREIEQERAALRLTPEEAARAIEELGADASSQFPDSDAALRPATAPATGVRPALVWAAVAALVVPLASLVVYDRIGAPGLVAFEGSAPHGDLDPKRVSKAIDELEERVRRKPDDIEGWALLGQAYRFTNDAAKAAQAYGKAVALAPQDAQLLADYAETLAVLHNGEFAGRPLELLTRAIAIAPKDGKVLSLTAAAQYRAGNLPEALRHLRTLLEILPPGSGEEAPIKDAIAKVESELGPAPAGRAAAPAAGSAAGPAAGTPSGAPSGAPSAGTPPASQAAAKPGAGVSGSVTIDDALRAKVPAGALLFIVARDPEGPRTPLAVRRVPADAWPVKFELADSDAMDPSRPLSGARQIVVEARVSARGEAMRQSGDPIGASPALAPGARNVTIRIDRLVP